MGPKFAWAGQAATGEYILLDEVGAAHIALKKAVVDHDALHAGPSSRLEQARQRGKVGGPIFAPHSLNHLDGTNGVKGRVLNIPVVLQPQVSALGHAQALNAFECKAELLGAQGHADQCGPQFRGTNFSQGAPAAANLE